MKQITFYLDFISPYAYLAFEHLPRALEGLSYSVEYRPVLFAGMLKEHGQLGPAEIAPNVHALIAVLKKTFPALWLETVDERFTSRMAQQTLLASGKGKMARREKGQLDRISATIILQGWMEGGGSRH